MIAFPFASSAVVIEPGGVLGTCAMGCIPTVQDSGGKEGCGWHLSAMAALSMCLCQLRLRERIVSLGSVAVMLVLRL